MVVARSAAIEREFLPPAPACRSSQQITLHDAYMHARKLIKRILFRVGHDPVEAWKVVILNDARDAQMIVPFSVSHAFNARYRKTG